MGRRAMFALGLAVLMVLTGVAPTALARRPSMLPATVADHCVSFVAGNAGSATSRDGTLTVTVTAWGKDGRHVTWDGHGISQALVPTGRELTPLTPDVPRPAFVVFCALLETGQVGWLV